MLRLSLTGREINENLQHVQNFGSTKITPPTSQLLTMSKKMLPACSLRVSYNYQARVHFHFASVSLLLGCQLTHSETISHKTLFVYSEQKRFTNDFKITFTK